MRTISIDANQSVINWEAFKTGGEHIGTLRFKNGTLELNDQNMPVGGTFEFDMNTIDDSDQSGFMKEKLETHLKSSDFFDVEKYPEAGFEIEKVDHTPDSSGYYGVSGDLTIKGIKNEILFKAKYTVEGDLLKVETSKIIVDRTKWGVNYGSKNIFKKVADHVIADNFDVTAVVVAQLKG